MRLTIRQTTSRYTGYLLVGACALVPCHAVGQSYQSQAPTIKQITVAAWSVPVKSQTKEPKQRTASRSGWRNTFGRERKTAQWRKLGTNGVDADIVVLKNLQSLKDVRRIFPARTHQIIASRAALANINQLTETATGQLERQQTISYPGFPAIALRRRRGLRVTTARHLTAKVRASASGANQQAVLYAGLAVQIWVSGRPIWILTPVGKATCTTIQCETDKLAKRSIEQWLKTTGGGDTAILLATSVQSNDQADQRQQDGQTSENKAQHRSKCTHARRPSIQAAEPFPEHRIKISPVKTPTNRPCASIATLRFEG